MYAVPVRVYPGLVGRALVGADLPRSQDAWGHPVVFDRRSWFSGIGQTALAWRQPISRSSAAKSPAPAITVSTLYLMRRVLRVATQDGRPGPRACSGRTCGPSRGRYGRRTSRPASRQHRRRECDHGRQRAGVRADRPRRWLRMRPFTSPPPPHRERMLPREPSRTHRCGAAPARLRGDGRARCGPRLAERGVAGFTRESLGTDVALVFCAGTAWR